MHIVTSLSTEKKQIKTLYVSQTFSEAQTFVENLKSVQLNGETVNVTASRKYPPGEDDHDGYYLVSGDVTTDHFELFSKKTLISRGYVWNGVEQEIKPVLSIYITYYNSRQHENCSEISRSFNRTTASVPSGNSKLKESGDLVDRSVYNAMMSQLLEKVKEKCSETETLPQKFTSKDDEPSNSFVTALQNAAKKQ